MPTAIRKSERGGSGADSGANAGEGNGLERGQQESLLLAAAGLTAGLAAAWGVTRLVASQLFEIRPQDPLTLVLARDRSDECFAVRVNSGGLKPYSVFYRSLP